jgi:hypothetical protein
MGLIRVAGRAYTHPDLIEFIRHPDDFVERVPFWFRPILGRQIDNAGRGPIDPYIYMVKSAARLSEMGQSCFRSPQDGDPRERLEYKASLIGYQVSADRGLYLERGDEGYSVSGPGEKKRIVYDPDRPKSRINFTLAHEIAHATLGMGGLRHEWIGGRPVNADLETLCDFGAAEFLIPLAELREVLDAQWGLDSLPRLTRHFGSSVPATLYRLASSCEGQAIAGRLRYLPLNDKISGQNRTNFFAYRRVALHRSKACCSPEFDIPYGTPFQMNSAVYACDSDRSILGCERLPNSSLLNGDLEVMRAPYQPDEKGLERPDLLFLWRTTARKPALSDYCVAPAY